MLNNRLRKNERIVSQLQVDRLFSGKGSHTRAAFPLRVVFLRRERDEASRPAAQLLISVPKRRFHHAVDRNRVKRQIREAYRNNKQLLLNDIPPTLSVDMAFIWISNSHVSSEEIASCMNTLLRHIAKKVNDDEKD